MKEKEDYSKSGMFSRQIIPDWNMHQGSNQREVLILPRLDFLAAHEGRRLFQSGTVNG
jgi:hypothetical protein